MISANTDHLAIRAVPGMMRPQCQYLEPLGYRGSPWHDGRQRMVSANTLDHLAIGAVPGSPWHDEPLGYRGSPWHDGRQRMVSANTLNHLAIGAVPGMMRDSE